MTRIQTEKRSLPTELTPEELAKESDRLATAVKEVEKQEEHIAEQKGLWTEKKKAMEGYLSHLKEEMGTLATVVDTGVADREVECSWLYSLRQGYGFLVRDDTGELVTHRRLGDQERQENLLEVLREPTEEQLKEWTESLGLVLDPQQDLELAAPATAGAPVYYKRILIPGEEENEAIIGRFTEADHRPSSLTGVHLCDTEEEDGVDPATHEYDDFSDTVRIYRQALEEVLATRQADAVAKNRAGGDPTVAEKMSIVPEPAPIDRGRKGK